MKIKLAELISEGNVRSNMDPAGIASLAETMKNGQLQPIGVERYKGIDPKIKWLVKYGHRRFAAAALLGWDDIEAVKSDGPIGKVEQMAENLAREDLSTYDVAVGIAAIRAEKLAAGEDIAGAEIARLIGRSPGYVNNLERIHASLDPRLMEVWRKESAAERSGQYSDGPVMVLLTMHRLVRLASLPKETQWGEYEKMLTARADGAAPGNADNKPRRGRPSASGTPKPRDAEAIVAQIAAMEEEIKGMGARPKNSTRATVLAARVAALMWVLRRVESLE